MCRFDPRAHKGILSVALYARMYTKTVRGVLCAHVAQEYSRSNTAGRRHADDDGKRGGRNDRLQCLRSSDAGVAHGSVLTAMISIITRQEGIEGNPELSFVSCHGVRHRTSKFEEGTMHCCSPLFVSCHGGRHHLFTVLSFVRPIDGK